MKNMSSKQQAASSKQQAASSKQQAASSKQQAASSKQLPITLLIGYRWSESPDKKEDGLNDRWRFLRDQVQTAADELGKRAAQRTGAPNKLRVSVGRLRGHHGTTLMGGILRKIERADILLFDITGDNPNVHFELGYALAIKGADSGRVFVFRENGKDKTNSADKPCSDLSGYMLTLYQRSETTTGKSGSKPSFKLNDPKGFLAALRTILIGLAEEREMWGQSKKLLEELDD
jgi:nucleoside 2-deoxyribosyltransferase